MLSGVCELFVSGVKGALPSLFTRAADALPSLDLHSILFSLGRLLVFF